MRVLAEYDNVKIIEKDESAVPLYISRPYEFTDAETKVLESHDKLLTEAELEVVRREPDVDLRKEVIAEYLRAKIPSTKNRDQLIQAIINKVLGYGDISRLVDDKNLEEIMVNGVNLPVFVFHRKFGMCQSDMQFTSKEDILKIVNRVCWVHNREIKPIIDLSTIDGSRLNFTLEPLALHGPTLTLRKQRKHSFTITQLIELGTMDTDIAALLWLAVDGMRLSPANMIICGMVGSGKTSTLNSLAMLTPPGERIITIEETPEIRLDGKENWIPLTPSSDTSIEDLVRNTLRMRPDKIIVGEIRGNEAMALFNAMNVGHRGMCTLHSTSPREAIYRLQSPPMNIPSMVVTNLDLIVVENIFYKDNRPIRRITEVAEVGGHEADTILLGTIYQWDPKKDRATESDEMAPIAFLEKLARKAKVTKRQVVKELNRRKAFLDGMMERSIFEHDDVLNTINAFYQEERHLASKAAEELSSGLVEEEEI